jgi:hypothetical protein
MGAAEELLARAEWFHPETIELDEIEFRCSQTGARFIVQLARRSPLHKFVVQAIKNAPLRYDAGEYNWASFFCPYCNASNFIKCGADISFVTAPLK